MYNILVVEDDVDGADVIRRILNTAGYQAAVVSSGETALDMLETQPDTFSAIVIDLALPEMDGFELMNIIRGADGFAELPLLAITAYHAPELKVQALEAGFNAYFPKPLDNSVFIHSLSRLLSKDWL